MKKDLIIYGYNYKNLGDDLMFAEIINKTNYDRYFFIGHEEIPHFVNKKIQFIKPGRLMKLRWKRKADFAVIGGSVLMGASAAQESMIKQKLAWFTWNKRLGGRNFIVGANLGPFKDESAYLALLKELGQVVDKWFVRDDYSIGLLDKVKTHYKKLMPDIVMGLDVSQFRQEPDNSVAISVTVVAKDNNKLIDSEKYSNEIAKLAELYASQGKTINFLSFEDSVDLAPIEHIINRMTSGTDQVNVIKNGGNNIIEALGRAEIVISTRFHAMVLGALFNKQQIIYSYNNKTTQFAHTYGFTTYKVDGDIAQKVPQFTEFDANSLNFVKSYADMVEE